MRRFRTIIAIGMVLITSIATASPAQADAQEMITRKFDKTFYNQATSVDWLQNAGTDIFEIYCRGIRDEPYTFSIYQRPKIISSPQLVFQQNLVCKPDQIVLLPETDRGVFFFQFTKVNNGEHVNVYGEGSYTKQTD